MKYITVNDLASAIRNNIHKIPHDIDFIIGVPRSGMIAAGLISSYLNVPLISLQGFVSGLEPEGGVRLLYHLNSHKKTNKVLVVDDTVFKGSAMMATKEELKKYTEYEFIYLCVFMEKNIEVPDIYLEDVRKDIGDFGIVLYEWNVLQHHNYIMSHYLFDMDGVLCVDPPDERNTEQYVDYIKDAVPLFIPKSQIGGIITYRLNIYRDITEKWLNKYGIHHTKLTMFKAGSWVERNDSGVSAAVFKGEYYRDNDNYKLFIESDDDQAQVINAISHKPVLCIKTNKLYN